VPWKEKNACFGKKGAPVEKERSAWVGGARYEAKEIQKKRPEEKDRDENLPKKAPSKKTL